MLPDIVAKLRERTAASIQQRPCYSNSASEIGAACERYLTYRRTSWDQAKPVSVELAEIFAEGHLHEQAVIADMRAAGIEVIEQQTTLAVDKRANVTGHVDGVIVVDGVRVPFDVKSMSEHIWRTVALRGAGVYDWAEVAEAFRAKPWLRKYAGQLQLYMYGFSVERGLLLCKNKATGALAQIVMALDLDLCGDLLARGERIEAHVVAWTYPDRIPWDVDECGRCAFLHLCCPERVDTPPERWIDAAEIAEACVLRESTEATRRLYEEADAKVKSWAKAQDGADVYTVGSNGNRFRIARNATRAGVRVTVSRADEDTTATA